MAGRPIVATDIKAHRVLLERTGPSWWTSQHRPCAGIRRVLDDRLGGQAGERARQHSGRGAGASRLSSGGFGVGRVCDCRAGCVRRLGHGPEGDAEQRPVNIAACHRVVVIPARNEAP